MAMAPTRHALAMVISWSYIPLALRTLIGNTVRDYWEIIGVGSFFNENKNRHQ